MAGRSIESELLTYSELYRGLKIAFANKFWRQPGHSHHNLSISIGSFARIAMGRVLGALEVCAKSGKKSPRKTLKIPEKNKIPETYCAFQIKLEKKTPRKSFSTSKNPCFGPKTRETSKNFSTCGRSTWEKDLRRNPSNRAEIGPSALFWLWLRTGAFWSYSGNTELPSLIGSLYRISASTRNVHGG